MKLEDGETVVEAEAFEAGNEIFVVTADSKVALPEGSYILENGSNVEVDANGVIISVGEQTPAEAPAEAPAEPEAEVEASTEAPAQTPKKIVESVTKETHLAEIKKLEDLIAEKEAKITELSAVPEVVAEVVELAETPALVHSAEKATKKENKTFKINKSQSTKSRVWDSLFN
ncbi:hypothetical protein N8Y76_01350 [Flavobacteriaceae bacterium]|nr:hypothetical protein [Flavobacteriaceae bacterium]